MIDWLFTNALAALALAVIAGVLIWTFRPSPAVRHALWLIVVVKLVSPTGLVVSVPLPVDRTASDPRETRDPEAAPADPLVEEQLVTVVVSPRPGETVEAAAARTLRAQSANSKQPDADSGKESQGGASPFRQSIAGRRNPGCSPFGKLVSAAIARRVGVRRRIRRLAAIARHHSVFAVRSPRQSSRRLARGRGGGRCESPRRARAAGSRLARAEFATRLVPVAADPIVAGRTRMSADGRGPPSRARASSSHTCAVATIGSAGWK